MTSPSRLTSFNFENHIRQFIQVAEKHPADWDAIQKLIQEKASFVSQREIVSEKRVFDKKVGANYYIIQKINNIYSEELKHINSPLSAELINKILTYFIYLNRNEWDDLFSHPFSQYLFKYPAINVCLLDNDLVPENRKLELIKLAGSSLIKLDLSGSTFSVQELKQIFENCPNIRELCLSCYGHQLDLGGCGWLPKKLQKLDLGSWVWLTNAAIKDLPKTLQTLNLSGCNRLTDAVFSYLPEDLQALYLGCNRLTDAAIKALPKTLHTLSLSGCEKVTDAAIKDLPEDLQILDLSYCYQLTDAAIKDLPKKLHTLLLDGGIQLTDAAIKDLPKTLKQLDLPINNELTDKSIKDLPRDLQVLDLSHSKLTDAAIKDLPKGLQVLRLAYCHNLTNAVVKDLPETLQTLELGGGKQITRVFLNELKHLPNLKEVN